MSLETVIAENTAALKELIAAISKGVPVAASTVAQVAEQANEKKSGAEEKASAAAASSQSGAAHQTAAQQDSAPAADLTYDDIKAPFLQLIKDKGRDAAANLLKPFGAAKLPDVKPEDFGSVLEAIKAALGEEALA